MYPRACLLYSGLFQSRLFLLQLLVMRAFKPTSVDSPAKTHSMPCWPASWSTTQCLPPAICQLWNLKVTALLTAPYVPIPALFTAPLAPDHMILIYVWSH